MLFMYEWLVNSLKSIALTTVCLLITKYNLYMYC